MKNETGCSRRFGLVLALILALFFSGCVGTAAQLLYVIKGHKKKAEFAGLAGKSVAVICLTDNAAYGADRLSSKINSVVSALLKKNVKKCRIVSPSQVDDWVDKNGLEGLNYAAFGHSLDADMVVAIDLSSYTIKEGQTLYKGRVNLTVTVYDVAKGGEIAYLYAPNEYSFPKNGRPAIQTSEQQFEAVFLAKLTDHIARLFYDSDQLDMVAEDASMM